VRFYHKCNIFLTQLSLFVPPTPFESTLPTADRYPPRRPPPVCTRAETRRCPDSHPRRGRVPPALPPALTCATRGVRSSKGKSPSPATARTRVAGSAGRRAIWACEAAGTRGVLYPSTRTATLLASGWSSSPLRCPLPDPPSCPKKMGVRRDMQDWGPSGRVRQRAPPTLPASG
jgi:hypothetical protein